MPGVVGGRPGLRRLVVPYFLAASLRCQASSVAGVTGKTSAQRLRGISRASAASQTRSVGSYRTRHVSKQAILSSTRQANQHHIKRAGESAGQPLNRVFEWYRVAESGRRAELLRDPGLDRRRPARCDICSMFT